MIRTLSPLLLLGILAQPAVAQGPSPSEDPIGPGRLSLQYAAFDPTTGEPAIPATLRADEANGLWIAQFDRAPTDADRAAVSAVGGSIHGYLPTWAYVVRMPIGAAAALQRAASGEHLRWIGAYHPAYRLETFLVAEHLRSTDVPTRRYNVFVVDKATDKPQLARKVAAIGGRVVDVLEDSILMTVELDGAQLVQAARFDEVLYIDRWTPAEEDMDNVRIQGGANFIEGAGGYTGAGLNGYVYEGVNPAVADFNTRPRAIDCGSSSSHGHSTATIIFGNGAASPRVRGLAPDAAAFFTHYTCTTNSRFQNVGTAVNQFDCSFKTASWGNARTRLYTTVSADTDDIIFAHDIAWTQSQSNAGNPDSRPQAWAKNVFSIGGVGHRDNPDPRDDSWLAGNGSTGPAADGRIKPTLAGYYDDIETASVSGGITSFGGTSGATPINAGHNALAIQMFTDGLFGNTLRNPGGSRHSNRPHFTTLKALMVANSAQYPFTSTSNDNRREHVGFGFPNVRTIYENRNRMTIVDETDILTQGQSISYPLQVQAGDPEIRVALNWAEPAANPSASQTIINDLSLRVTDPNGTVYWGNNGLWQGNFSTPGGTANTVDTLEVVAVQSPVPGTWTAEVFATRVVMDNHVETPAVDVDFGLVASFGTTSGYRPGSITPFGQPCVGTGQTPNSCADNNPNGGTLANTSNGNEYAIRAISPVAIQVSGFEFYTAGGATMNTSLYLDAGGSPATTAARTGTMTVGGTPGFYSTQFQPITIPANTPFYLGADYAGGRVVHPQLTSGTPGTAYWRRSGTSWSRSGVITVPSYRVQCVGGGGQNAAPVMNVTGTPSVASTLTFDLLLAAPSTPAVLFLGVNDQQWGNFSLPLDLGRFGAPTCNLYIDPTFPVAANTDASGSASVPIAVPANTGLVGNSIYEQFVVTDPGANGLGLVTTRAFQVTLGN